MVAACCDSEMTGNSVGSVIHKEDSRTPPAIYRCVFTDVSEDCSAFIFRVGQLVTMQNLDYELTEILANVTNCLPSNSPVRRSSIEMHTAQGGRWGTAPNENTPFSFQVSTMHSIVRYFTVVSVTQLYSVCSEQWAGEEEIGCGVPVRWRRGWFRTKQLLNICRLTCSVALFVNCRRDSVDITAASGTCRWQWTLFPPAVPFGGKPFPYV